MDRFRALVEQATSPNLPAGHEDIALNLDICDAVRSRQVQPQHAMNVLRARLEHDNPVVQLLTLGLTDLCVKNGGGHFFLQIASPEYMELIFALLRPPDTLNYDVRDKMLRCLVEWACFADEQEQYRHICETKARLADLGVEFPEPDPHAVAAARAFTETLVAPEWTDGPVCTRCRAEFTTFLRKHHCRNCGRVFCYRCSSKTASLPWYGIGQDVRVCDGCYARRGPHEIAMPKTKLPRKPTREEKDIERAIALSLETPAPKPPPAADDDADLAAAIAASLRDLQERDAQPRASLADAPAPAPAPAPAVPPRPPLELDTRDIDNVLTFAQTVTEDAPWRASGHVPQPVQNMYERAAASRVSAARMLDDGNKRLHALTSVHERLAEAVRLYDRLLDAQMSSVATQHAAPEPVPQRAVPPPAPQPAPKPAPQPAPQPAPAPQPRRTAFDLLADLPVEAPAAPSAPPVPPAAAIPSAPMIPLTVNEPPAAAPPASASAPPAASAHMPELPSAPDLPVMPSAPQGEVEPKASVSAPAPAAAPAVESLIEL